MYNYSDTGFFTSALYTSMFQRHLMTKKCTLIFCHTFHVISVILAKTEKASVSPVTWLSFTAQQETSKGLVSIYNLVQFCTLLMALSNVSEKKKTHKGFLYSECLIFKCLANLL